MINKIDNCLQYKLVVLGLAVTLGIAGCMLLDSAQPTATPIEPAKVLLDEPVQTVTAPVKVYAPKVKKTLALPKAVQDNSAKVVLTASDLPKSKYERTVTTVLDSDTGEATQYVQEKPLPLFASASTGSLGAYVGLKNLEPAVRVQATQDLFTVKAVTFGAVAAVDVTQTGRTDTFVGVGARLDW